MPHVSGHESAHGPTCDTRYAPSRAFQRCRRRNGHGRYFLPVRLPSFDYLVGFSDGARERYRLAYIGSIEAERERNTWHYRGHLSRQWSIYNRAGERYEQADIERRVSRVVVPADLEYPALVAGADDDFEPLYRRFVQIFMKSLVIDKSRVHARLQKAYPGVVTVSEVD